MSAAYDEAVLDRLVGEIVGSRPITEALPDGTRRRVVADDGTLAVRLKRFPALRVYRVERAYRGVSLVCPKCHERRDVTTFRLAPCITVKFPEFTECPACHKDERLMPTCARCHGKGFVVKRTWDVACDLACMPCLAEMRDGRSGRGHAASYTTNTHAGEYMASHDRVDRVTPMCTACQQNAATRDGLCRACQRRAAHDAARTAQTEARTLTRRVEQLTLAIYGAPVGTSITLDAAWQCIRDERGTRLVYAACDVVERRAYGVTHKGERVNV